MMFPGGADFSLRNLATIRTPVGNNDENVSRRVSPQVSGTNKVAQTEVRAPSGKPSLIYFAVLGTSFGSSPSSACSLVVL